MKKAVLCALAACAVMLCSCEQKNDSMRTESQAETTTKATGLTIASQSKTGTTTMNVTTTTRAPDNTVFTSKDPYHTEIEGKTEIMEFCKFITRHWTAVYDGGNEFDFSPYCRYSELANYLNYSARYSVKEQKFGAADDCSLTELEYWESKGTVNITAIYSTKTGSVGEFYFIVQTVDGKLMLSDMFYESMSSVDMIVRAEQRSLRSTQYWAKQGRCNELIEMNEKIAAAYTVSDLKTLKDADKEKISEFCRYIADSWANFNCVDWGNDSFFRYLKYDHLGIYFKQTCRDYAVDGGRYFYPDRADLKIESIKLSGEYATVNGTYPNYLGQQVGLVIIVENVGGKLMLNDLICAQKNLPDALYRPEDVKNPKPNLWAQTNKLAQIEKKMP
ncbi:MAG: hypothetical protein II574_09585, partial [Ruminococcus sp.]|nr:hypothetical protein [Ruminococcus sp.]